MSSFALAAPPPTGQFVYETHLARLDHAQLAHAAGFELMWGYLSSQQVEPTRNHVLFKDFRQVGSTTGDPPLDGSGSASSFALTALVELAVNAAYASSATGPGACCRTSLPGLPGLSLRWANPWEGAPCRDESCSARR